MSETIIVKRTGQAPLRIRGESLAEAESSLNNAHPRYSGATGRSQSCTIYRTSTGRFVVAIHHTTQWQWEHGSDEAAVFPSLGECIGFVGERLPRWMVEDLVEQIGPETLAVDVD